MLIECRGCYKTLLKGEIFIEYKREKIYRCRKCHYDLFGMYEDYKELGE